MFFKTSNLQFRAAQIFTAQEFNFWHLTFFAVFPMLHRAREMQHFSGTNVC